MSDPAASPVHPPLVHIVDDDPALRDSIAFLVSSVGYAYTTHPSGEAFLADWQPGRTACLVADVRMPGMSGLELQQELNKRDATLGLLFVTGHGDIPMAVRAIKAGAVDFLEKPFDDQLLLDKINEALRHSTALTQSASRRAEAEKRLSKLTEREREVLALVVAGKTNKAIAVELDISVKTVEAHRHNIMEKVGAASAAELGSWVSGQ